MSTPIALARFLICDRSFWQTTTMPEGMWVTRTAESVVLTPWPPFPEERYTSTRISLSGISISISSLISAMTSTAQNEVWRLLFESNGLIRTSRWTPRSALAYP